MKHLFITFSFFLIFAVSAFGQEYKYHTVEKGETVYSIARNYNITEEAIYKYNPDAKGGIEVSGKLVIPIGQGEEEKESSSQPINFKTHKVAKKETLYSLANKYQVEIEDIKRYNKHLYSKELQRGEEIKIPVIADNRTVARISETSSEKIKEQITDTREHVVLPKETKYGIARKYGITVKELEALNPKVEVLQPGVMIKVGTNVLDEPVVLTDDVFEFYEVKPKETLFGLTRKFEVDKDSLIALNPALKDGLKSGMVLKVPNKGEGISEIAEDETEEMHASGTKDERLEKLDLKNSLNNFDTKEVVVMLPYNLNRIETDSISKSKEIIQNQRTLRISLDFYSGVLMAVEEAKELNISTNLRVYDTKQNPEEVRRIINSNNFNNVDAVIGPLLQTTTEAAASGLGSQKIPVITPLSNKLMNPSVNLFQSRPSDNMLVEAMLTYLEKNVESQNLILIIDPGASEIKSILTDLFPGVRIVSPQDGHISESRLGEILSKDGENWVILESSRVGVLSSATSALNRLARNRQITLFTTNKNNSYDNDNVSNNHLARLNFHYPSVDKEYDKKASKEFIEKYKEEYSVVPNQYAVRGYDLTLDILLRLASADNFYESFERNRGYTEYNENKFNYQRRDGGGFYNDAVYIMKMNEDLTLSVVNDNF